MKSILRATYSTLRNKSLKQKGQGMVEFALTFPILLMLILGIMEFGRLMFTYTSVITAAREAARYGAAAGTIEGGGAFYYQDCNGIRDKAVAIGSIAAIDRVTGIDIQYDNGPGLDNIAATCLPDGTGPNLDLGDRIEVTVTAQFQPAQGLIPIPPLTIRSTVRRTIVTNVEVR